MINNMMMNNNNMVNISNSTLVLNPYWITGFTDAEGSFQITSQRNGFKFEFKVTQKNTSSYVLHAKIGYFKCGRVNIDNRKYSADKFVVTSLNDLVFIIIPFFDKYSLITKKYLDYLDFKQVLEIMNKGEPRPTDGGLIKIRKIKSGMNRNRIINSPIIKEKKI